MLLFASTKSTNVNLENRYKEYSMYSGIASGVVFVIGTIIAMITYPNYSIAGNFFSDTGLRIDQVNSSGDLIMAHPHPEIFSITLYLTAILILPFYLSIPLIMNTDLNRSIVSRIFYWLCTLVGLIIVPATVSVGIYDWGTNLSAHVIAAQITLTGILFFVLFWALADVFLNDDHPYKAQSRTGLDFGVSVFIIICSYTQIGLPVPDIMTRYITLQIYQKLAIYSALIYVAIIARRLLLMLEGTQDPPLRPNANGS